MLYLIWGIVQSVVASGLKGIKIPFDPISPNGTDWKKNAYGWLDSRMKPHWLRLVAGGESWSHVYTNLLVEWFEMDKESLRRGVKLFSGVILTQWLIIVILTLLLL